MNLLTLSSALAVTAGFIFVMYVPTALKSGIPIGKLFLTRKSWLVTIGWLMIIPAGIELISLLGILFGLGLTLGCFVASGILISTLKSHTQIVSLLMALASIIIWIVGGATVHSI